MYWLIVIVLIGIYMKVRVQLRGELTIGILHPACNSGGGGEKVLWSIVESIMMLLEEKEIKARVFIYSGEEYIDKITILEKAEKRFNMKKLSQFQDKLQICFIHDKSILLPQPFLTIFLQILSQIYFASKAILTHPAHIIIDTQGYPFSYFIIKFFSPKSKIISYTHYPYISNIMIHQVQSQQKSFKNSSYIVNNRFLTFFKFIYYKILYYSYKSMMFFVDFVFVNSTWTYNNIKKIWNFHNDIHVLYPPCNIEDFGKLDIKDLKNREKLIISFAQFRPEKQQKMQLEIFKELLEQNDEVVKDVKMVIIGSCRGKEDENLLKDLTEYSRILGIDNQVTFMVNQEFPSIIQIMQKALIALHTMHDEHFGISVVELMSAGVITIAHNSAGPKLDIIQHTREQSGFLANNKQDYVKASYLVLQNHHHHPHNSQFNQNIRNHARKKVLQFSQQSFLKNFQSSFIYFLQKKYPQYF